MLLHALSSLSLLVAAHAGPLAEREAAPSATIDAGVIVGTTTSLPGSTVVVKQFLGVPFASPPTRFSPPVQPEPWYQPLDTSKQAPACIQQFNYPAAVRNFTITLFDTPGPPAGESEDCLYIDVYVPTGGAKVKPVLFWIYGGALQFGSNSAAYYDGTSFAANQDVILVAPNYRTNVFGFPMSPQLPLDQTNLGFLDQRFALDWVQRNIQAFGGDPKRVTIFGESAGAASVDELVTTMPDKPPFHAAIMESGQTSFYDNHNNSNRAPWNAIVAAVNCSTAGDILACMRAVPAATLKNVEELSALAFVPLSDNVTQLEFPEAARAAGKIARVPILTGSNAQDGSVFVQGITDPLTLLNATFPGQTALNNAILAEYPLGAPGLPTGYAQACAIFTDFVFQCPAAMLAQSSAAAGIPTWRYYFNATFPNLAVFPHLGVYHSSEIPFVFGNYPRTNATQAEARLSEYIQSAWATFARNPMGGPSWPAWPTVAVLGSPGKGLRYNSNVTALDQNCVAYAPIYAAEGI